METGLIILMSVICVISFILVLLFAVFGLYEYIKGPKDTKKLLIKIGSPFGYRAMLVIGFTAFAVFVVSFILLERFYGYL